MDHGLHEFLPANITFHLHKIRPLKKEPSKAELLADLKQIAPCLLNCHRLIKSGCAVGKKKLIQSVVSSFCKNVFPKTYYEVDTLYQLFLDVVPDYFVVKRYNGQDWVTRKNKDYELASIIPKIEEAIKNTSQDVARQ